MNHEYSSDTFSHLPRKNHILNNQIDYSLFQSNLKIIIKATQK